MNLTTEVLLQTVVINGVVNGALIALLALAFGLPFYLKLFRIDLANYLFLGAALPLIWVNSSSHWLLIVSTTISMIMGIVSAFQEKYLHAGVSRRGGELLDQMLLSMGLFLVGLAFLHKFYGSEPIFYNVSGASFILFGNSIPYQFVISLFLIVLIIVLLGYNLIKRGIWNEYLATTSNPMLAEAIGIAVPRIRIGVAALAGFITSFSGMILVSVRGVTVYSCLWQLLISISLVLLTNKPSFIVLIIGGLVIGLLQEICGLLFGELWREVLVYLLLVVALVLRAKQVPQQKHLGVGH